MNLTGKEIHNKEPQLRTDIRILVVDDREDNLLSLETILEREGYTVIKANSGRAALKLLLKQHDFSLILMDVQMPEMNGLEAATLIYEREKLRHIPIIFITAHQFGEELMFKGYKMGGVDYIYKPVDPELLRFKVGVYVELYQKTHELINQEERLKAINQSLETEITERRLSENRVKLLNQQLQENNTELKTINEELDRFAFVASHDLQEPLRKILLFNGMIAKRLEVMGDDSVIADYFQKISRATERMQLLINDLLKYSRNTQLVEHFNDTDLNEVLNEVLSDLEIDIRKTKAVINAGQLPVLFVIPTQIRQLFQNLISNSIKFARPGEFPRIEIFSELVNDAGENTTVTNSALHRIYVKDNGMGFDPKYANDIFVVFKRLHSYHEIEGTGIGLSICKKIVERHNGSITATSVPDEGATFVVTLPEKISAATY